MKKGISPLIASVLLIAITMAIAAVLATWVQGIVSEQQQQALATCPFGSYVNYISSEYPKLDASGHVVAVVSGNVDFGNFRFAVTYDNDSVSIYDDANNLNLAAGGIGDVRTTETFSSANIKSVIVTTNCSNVKTEARSLR